jgi:hypothetical protein
MTRKTFLIGLIMVLSSLMIFAQGVMSYVPANSNLVLLFQNNGANYDSLKNNVPVFSFLLNDLGLESLVQSSVSNTANSLGLKSAQIWQATLNDFVVFGSENQKDIAIVVKANAPSLVKFFQALVGGSVGSESYDGKQFQTFSINGMKLYFYSDSSYTLISNSTSLIVESLNAKAGSAFKFTQAFPQNAWFEMYANGTLPVSAQGTNLVTPNNLYGYGTVNNGTLSVYGIFSLNYNDSALKNDILSSKVNSLSLTTANATGDVWVAFDTSNPSAFYNVLKPYINDLKTPLKDEMTKDFVSHFSGKAFGDMNVMSGNGQFAATFYLNQDLSKYVPTLSKDASATFVWQGHTVLRNDTVEGTKTVSMYTIFYPDKVVFSNMAPDQTQQYINSGVQAKNTGNYSTFAPQLWNDSFMTGYANIGAFIENALQYSVNSGIVVQMKFDNNANAQFQILVK